MSNLYYATRIMDNASSAGSSSYGRCITTLVKTQVPFKNSDKALNNTVPFTREEA